MMPSWEDLSALYRVNYRSALAGSMESAEVCVRILELQARMLGISR